MSDINQILIIFAGLYSINKHQVAAQNIISNSILAMFICFIIGIPVIIYDFVIFLKNYMMKKEEPFVDIDYDDVNSDIINYDSKTYPLVE